MTKKTLKADLGQVLSTGRTSEAVTTLDELIAALEKYRDACGNVDLVFKKVDEGTVTIMAPNAPTYCCEAAEVVPASRLPPIPAFD